jgi:hypothetical protein
MIRVRCRVRCRVRFRVRFRLQVPDYWCQIVDSRCNDLKTSRHLENLPLIYPL